MRLSLKMFLLSTVVGMLLALGVTAQSAMAQPPACADLVITNFTVLPTDTPVIVAGRNAQVSITILNQGTCQSLSFNVEWRQSDDIFAPPGGPTTHQVGGIAAGASTKLEFVFAYPAAGDFTSVATLDPTNTVLETNESNNIDIEGVRVWANQPDLVVTGFNITPATPKKGEAASINVTVRNQGTADAGPFMVQWFQDDTFAPSGPSKQVGSLAAGASTVVNFSYAYQSAGNFNSVVRLDTSFTVTEWNEVNNMAIFPVTVIETNPDLVITNFTIKPVKPALNFPLDQPVAGQNAEIKITVKNQGSDPAGPFVVQWRSDGSLFTQTGPSYQVPGLAGGASTDVTFVYAFPSAGNFQTEVRIDTDFDVIETNENNNIQIKSVIVQQRIIDLVLTEFKVEPAPGVIASIPITPGAPLNPVRGKLALVTIKVENRGNVPAGSFRVSWEPQTFVPQLSNQVNSLDYDASITINFDYTYPRSFNPVETVFTTAKVDDLFGFGQIPESNEGNNNQTKAIILEEQLPDLIIADIEFVPASPVATLPAKARVTVFNRGNTAAAPFQVSFVQAPFVPQLAQQVNGLGVDNLAARTTVLEFDTTYGFPGTFNATATADFLFAVPELFEDNNSRSEDVVVQAATQDLTVTAVSIEETSCESALFSEAEIQALMAGELSAADLQEPILEQGKQYIICVTIQNLGTAPAGPFVVSVDPDAFELIVPSLDTLTHQVDTIAGGQELVVAFPIIYPQAGNFSINALVDAFSIIFETNEANNLFIYDVVVEATGPDLVISELVIGNSFFQDREGFLTCNRGEGDFDSAAEHNIPPFLFLTEPRLDEDFPTTVCIKVSNIGNRPSGDFVVEWNADAFDLITSGPTTLSEQVPGLGAGESQLIVFEFTYPQVGTFHTVAKADAFNDEPELNEENNLGIGDVVVDTTKPDLVIDELTVEPVFTPGPRINASCSVIIGAAAVEPVVIQGRAVQVCILVRNAGGQKSGPFVVAWNPDAFGLLVPGAGTISTQIDNLDPGQTVEVRMNFEYNQFNKFRTIAQVDFFNTVQESVEGNNEKILNIIVDPAPINLTVEFVSITPNEPDRGSAIQADIRVCENGNEYPTGGFFVEWRPTGEGIFNSLSRVQGLQPGQCQTVIMTSTILIADVYNSIAVVDPFNEIIETNESVADNSDEITIDVKPRKTTLEVQFTNIHANEAFEDGLNGDGEYELALILVDPTVTGQCDVSLDTGGGLFGLPNLEIKGDGLKCAKTTDNLENGDNFNPNVNFSVTLEESFPLIFGAVGVEEDDFADVSEFTGFVLEIWPPEDYLNVGERTVPAQFGDPPELGGSNSCNDETPPGACYTLTYKINVLDKPDPFFLSTAAMASVAAEGEPEPQGGPLPIPDVTLPMAVARPLPAALELPPFVHWPEGWTGWTDGMFNGTNPGGGTDTPGDSTPGDSTPGDSTPGDSNPGTVDDTPGVIDKRLFLPGIEN